MPTPTGLWIWRTTSCSSTCTAVSGWRRCVPRPSTTRSTALKRKLGDAVPAGWTPHWFRHTHASALLLSGAREHVVMRRLGHADIQTTLTLYGWVTEDAELRTLADWRTFCAGWRGWEGSADD